MDDLVSKFSECGYAVLREALSCEEITICRNGLHEDLLALGIDHAVIEAASNAGSSLSEDTRAALKRAQAHHTGALPLPFSPWRLRHCALNPKLVAAHRQVWTLYSEGVDERFASFRRGTFAPSAAAYPLLDAVGYRVPTAVCGEARQRVQRGLGTHLDLNPAEPWADLKVYSAHNSENGEELAYWRPLQCFVALTDGVFLCAEGLHADFDQLFSTEPGGVLHGIPRPRGRFFGLFGKRFSEIEARMVPVPFLAGDAVLWDSRLAHKTSEELPGQHVREVVYSAFLPDTPVNRIYAKVQASCLSTGRFPPSQAFGVAPLAKEGVKAMGGPDRASTDVTVPGWDPMALAELTPADASALLLDS